MWLGKEAYKKVRKSIETGIEKRAEKEANKPVKAAEAAKLALTRAAIAAKYAEGSRSRAEENPNDKKIANTLENDTKRNAQKAAKATEAIVESEKCADEAVARANKAVVEATKEVEIGIARSAAKSKIAATKTSDKATESAERAKKALEVAEIAKNAAIFSADAFKTARIATQYASKVAEIVKAVIGASSRAVDEHSYKGNTKNVIEVAAAIGVAIEGDANKDTIGKNAAESARYAIIQANIAFKAAAQAAKAAKVAKAPKNVYEIGKALETAQGAAKTAEEAKNETERYAQAAKEAYKVVLDDLKTAEAKTGTEVSDSISVKSDNN